MQRNKLLLGKRTALCFRGFLLAARQERAIWKNFCHMRTKVFCLHCHKMVHSDLTTNLTCSSASKRFILCLVKYTDAVILDGATVVNVVQPRGCKTFQDYAENYFIPYLQTEVRNAKRLDIVRDIYLPNSLKSATRKKQGTGKTKS